MELQIHKFLKLIVFSSFVVFVSCGSKKNLVNKTKNNTGYAKVFEHPAFGRVVNGNSVHTSSDVNLSNSDSVRRIALETSKSRLLDPTLTHTQRVDTYIDIYNDIAQREMRHSGIPASITLAQGILESGVGRSQLSISSNNHFGIKCHNSWIGNYVTYTDDAPDECFRSYDSVEDSYKDHSMFLVGRKRYANLFKLSITDYKGWARGLKKAGYATDPKYANNLIRIIEKYNLNRFDNQAVSSLTYYNAKGYTALDANPITIRTTRSYNNTSSSHTKNYSSSSYQMYKVKRGDTLYSIARKYNISVNDLKSINKLKDSLINIGQMLKISQ